MPCSHREQKRKRLADSLDKEILPTYDAKRSKKWPLQQRAIEWLTQAGKEHFEGFYAKSMARWGVKPSESRPGHCVLLLTEWHALDPLRLAELFTPDKECPHAWDDPVVRVAFTFRD